MTLVLALVAAQAAEPTPAAPPEPLRDEHAIIEAVKRTVLDKLPALRTCYDERLADDPTLRGSWTLDWTI